MRRYCCSNMKVMVSRWCYWLCLILLIGIVSAFLPRKSSKAVISVLRWHTPPGVSVTDARGQTEEPQHTAEGDEHPFVLVMTRGERSLHDACAKERLAGYDYAKVVHAFRCIVLCVWELHACGVVHADLKQR